MFLFSFHSLRVGEYQKFQKRRGPKSSIQKEPENAASSYQSENASETLLASGREWQREGFRGVAVSVENRAFGWANLNCYYIVRVAVPCSYIPETVFILA
jgi:hypothetical protein